MAAARARSPTACSRSSCAAAAGCGSPTSGRCARRRASRCIGLGIRDRRFGWPLEMVLRAADAGWRIEEVEVAYAPRDRPLEGHRHRCAGRPAPSRDMAKALR